MHLLISIVIFIVLVIVFILGLLVIIYFTHLHPSKSDYLQVLRYDEWKSGLEIRHELQSKLKGKIIAFEVHWNLAQLAIEGFVEYRIIEKSLEGHLIKIYEYKKKTSKINRKKIVEGENEEISEELVPA